MQLESYDIHPRYSTDDTIGRCVRCAAEDEMNSCLMHLLGDEDNTNDAEAERKFQALLTFLRSSESQRLVDESERLMAEGRKVDVRLYIEGNEAKYELIVE